LIPADCVNKNRTAPVARVRQKRVDIDAGLRYSKQQINEWWERVFLFSKADDMNPLRSFVLLWVLACGAFPIQAVGASPKVTIAHASMGVRTAPLWIAQEQKFFAKHGADAQLVFIRRAPALLAGINAGNFYVAAIDGAAALAAAAAGADLKIIASMNSRVGYDLVAAPHIRSADQLAGKRFGLLGYGGTVLMGIMLGMERLNIDLQTIDFVVVGDQPILAKALANGKIDAAALDPVFSRRLKQRGFTILAEFHDYNLPFITNGILSTNLFIKAQPRVLENMLKALLEGVAFALSPSNKAAVIDTLMRHVKISDPVFAEERYHDLLRGLEKNPAPNPDGIRNIHRLLKSSNPQLDKIKPEDLIDDRILKKLNNNGFIDQLYSSYGVK
jgi:NitT/TauT family transport system substrate-binding protein